MNGIKDTVAIFEQYRSVIKEQTEKPVATSPTNVSPAVIKNKEDVGGILKQIRTEIDSEDLNKALQVIQKSALPSNVKAQMEQLLKNTHVINIYKQIKGIPAGAFQNPDLVNLQAGSVSEPGSPSATGYKQP